uniref:Tumor necrosis factor receptor superfamily, member 1B n=1 Tax=Oncorhynchus kisutch TaxID=8019 RepID=A0A8C7EYJ9_ONCKI
MIRCTFMVSFSLQVYTLPYTPDSAEACRNKTAEYYNTLMNLCCSKCAPGTRLKNECSTTSDTVCEPCPSGQYSGTFNYFTKCFRCPKCSEGKGLQYAQDCSSTTKTQCMCQTGKFCIMEQHPNCKECGSYTHCQPGHGVAIEGTTDSDVNCAPCPNGTFSDQHSYTQTCQHHTDCVSQRRGVLTYGNTTSNAVCGPKVRPPTRPPTTIPTSGTGHTTPSLQSLYTDDKSPGFDLRIGKYRQLNTDAENQQDTRRTWVSDSLEGLSIGPLQSTPPQPSTQPSPQPTSPQPTSPLPSSPLVNVNITVNYPVTLGNGSCSTPTSTHIDSSQADPELPLSREEEVYVNMPQQEGGKEALTAIQESGNDV